MCNFWALPFLLSQSFEYPPSNRCCRFSVTSLSTLECSLQEFFHCLTVAISHRFLFVHNSFQREVQWWKSIMVRVFALQKRVSSIESSLPKNYATFTRTVLECILCLLHCFTTIIMRVCDIGYAVIKYLLNEWMVYLLLI